MGKICGIYKITNPKRRIYIGKSININRRKVEYKKLRCKTQRRLFYSIKKYGWENHGFIILCECNRNQLDELEIHYIKLYNTFNTEHGLNLTSGGESCYVSEETKLKISNSLKGKMPKNIDTLKSCRKGKPLTEEHKRKLSELKKGNAFFKGHKHSEKTKKLIGNIHRGKKLSEAHKRLLSQAVKKRRRKPIIQYDLSRNFIKRWESPICVQNELGFNKSCICAVANGKQKTAYKSIWKYE